MNNLNETKLTVNINACNVSTYLHDIMRQEIDDFCSNKGIRSGYENLDRLTMLYPGLYVLGAISSLGKTTFIHQLGDQLAEVGKHVLYFSFEQSRLELTTKSLARITAKQNSKAGITSLEIRCGEKDERLDKAIKEYGRYAGNITILECGFEATIADVEKCVKQYIDINKVKPVIIIDYLQVIASDRKGLTVKEEVDDCVKRLKQLQSDHGLIMFVISALNRQNYLTAVDFESFKESGGIEYTADVIWGLQLQIMNKELFDKTGVINEKREAVKKAKAENPRKIELVCLKNRFGISSYSCNFLYYSKYDYFESEDDLEEYPFK